MQYAYPDAVEELDPRYLTLKYDHILLATYYNANLGYNIVTCRSITGIIAWIGKTSIIAWSKQQTIVKVSVYGVEFNAGQKATKDLIEIRHILRSLSVKVDNLPNYTEIIKLFTYELPLIIVYVRKTHCNWLP